MIYGISWWLISIIMVIKVIILLMVILRLRVRDVKLMLFFFVILVIVGSRISVRIIIRFFIISQLMVICLCWLLISCCFFSVCSSIMVLVVERYRLKMMLVISDQLRVVESVIFSSVVMVIWVIVLGMVIDFIVIRFLSEKCSLMLNISRMMLSFVSFGVSLVLVIKSGVKGLVSMFVKRYFIRGEICSLLVIMLRIKVSMRLLIMVVISGVVWCILFFFQWCIGLFCYFVWVIVYDKNVYFVYE